MTAGGPPRRRRSKTMTRLWNPTRAASSRSSARPRASNPASTPVVFPLVSRPMRNPRRAARIILETSGLRCSGRSGGQKDSSSSAGMYCCEAPSPRPGVPVGVVPHQTGRLVKDRWLLAGQGGPDGRAPGPPASAAAPRQPQPASWQCAARAASRLPARAGRRPVEAVEQHLCVVPAARAARRSEKSSSPLTARSSTTWSSSSRRLASPRGVPAGRR
jgi:hypothetical protein